MVDILRLFESAVWVSCTEKLSDQFGLVASIKLDVLQGIFCNFGSPFSDSFSTSFLCSTSTALSAGSPSRTSSGTFTWLRPLLESSVPMSTLSLTWLKSQVFSLERLKKGFGSEEILGLKKVVKKKFWFQIHFGSKKIWGHKNLWVKKILRLK